MGGNLVPPSPVLTAIQSIKLPLPYGFVAHSFSQQRERSIMATRGMGERNHRFLIWGGNGWVAGHLRALLEAQGREVFSTTVRMEDRGAVAAELDSIRPTHVLNAAGCTGRPNVDWCEDNKQATIRSNVVGTLTIADCCFLRGIHCTVFATGCIYQYDEKHPWDGPGFVEADPPNFSGSFYSMTKAHVEEARRGRLSRMIVEQG